MSFWILTLLNGKQLFLDLKPTWSNGMLEYHYPEKGGKEMTVFVPLSQVLSLSRKE